MIKKLIIIDDDKPFRERLARSMEKKGFFVPTEKKHSMLLNINNLIYRLEPSDKEVRILASIISSLVKKNINHN